MPTNRTEPTPRGKYLKVELNILPEHNARITLLASYENTTRSAIVRRLLTNHLPQYLEEIVNDAKP